MNGAQAMVKCLVQEQTEVIFGYPGAAICPFYDALLDSPIRHVLVRQEQNAVHAASGYARVTGKAGVCVATSGPGATNMITGIATAYMDSIPIVAITGQVSTELIGRDVFQEADITGATEPFCKHNYLVHNVKDLPRIFKEAFYIATTGRPGPVLIDVPVDIQRKETEFLFPREVNIRGYKPTYSGHMGQIRKIAEAIEKAKAPVICAGGGIITSGARDELIKLAERCSIPVATTLMGIGAFPPDHPLNLGMLGTHGFYSANKAVKTADLLIIIGARVGDRALGATHGISKETTVVHIDIDPAEIGKNIGTNIPVVGDARQVLCELNSIARPGRTQEWIGQIMLWKEKHPLRKEWKPADVPDQPEAKEKSETKGANQRKPAAEKSYVKPQYLFSVLSELSDEKTILTTEVGQNQIWAAKYFVSQNPVGIITSGGMGTMGYGLPAAVGAKIACPGALVIAVCGDGSFQMSMPELGTIRQNNLAVKIIVLNNCGLGMVREIQKKQYQGRYNGVSLNENPDFVRLADAYGIKGRRIAKNEEVVPALKEFIADESAYLLEVMVDPEEPTL